VKRNRGNNFAARQEVTPSAACERKKGGVTTKRQRYTEGKKVLYVRRERGSLSSKRKDSSNFPEEEGETNSYGRHPKEKSAVRKRTDTRSAHRDNHYLTGEK